MEYKDHDPEEENYEIGYKNDKGKNHSIMYFVLMALAISLMVYGISQIITRWLHINDPVSG
jgi:hypothetical protein